MLTWLKRKKVQQAIREMERHRLQVLLIAQARQAKNLRQVVMLRALAASWLPARLQREVDQVLIAQLMMLDGSQKNTR